MRNGSDSSGKERDILRYTRKKVPGSLDVTGHWRCSWSSFQVATRLLELSGDSCVQSQSRKKMNKFKNMPTAYGCY